MIEEWKDIKGYEGLYKVSNFGRVKSLYSNKLLKCGDNGNGYHFIFLCKNGIKTRFYVHRLVALHFVKRIKGKNQVNHKDGNKANNHSNNLEWCTNQENLVHAVVHLNQHHAKKIQCIETKQIYYSITNASKSFNMHHSHLLEHLRGERKTFAGYHWKYL